MIVPFPAGGNVDIMGRILAQKLTDALGKQVIVENRSGASGMIGNEMVARSPKDGYTLLVNAISFVTTPMLYRKVSYDPIRDFDPVCLVSLAPNALVVHPALPVKSVKDLIALARAKPGQLNYGSAGSGTVTHLSGELFKVLTKTDVVHVPYKGSAPAMTDLISGQLQVMFATMPTVLQLIKAGRLRALAVTGSERFSGAPEFPTVAEAGVPGYEAYGWTGMFVPVNTPKEIVNYLAGETAKILLAPQTKELFLEQGAEPGTRMQTAFMAFLESEMAKWKKVVEMSGARAD
jgi:tripartite-type tricarboxylate transporter receptor subunit TctC